jgi:hypothetical protein
MREVEYVLANIKSACYPSAVRLILLGTHVDIRKAQVESSFLGLVFRGVVSKQTGIMKY